MSCDSQCSVALPNGAVGWSAKCCCGIPDHTHLLFYHLGACTVWHKLDILQHNDL